MGNRIKPFVVVEVAVSMKMVLNSTAQVAYHCPYSCLEFYHFANEMQAESFSLRSCQKLPWKRQLRAILIHLTRWKWCHPTLSSGKEQHESSSHKNMKDMLVGRPNIFSKYKVESQCHKCLVHECACASHTQTITGNKSRDKHVPYYLFRIRSTLFMLVMSTSAPFAILCILMNKSF